jgi:DNA-directed RNA polymerase specialized sigma24 family protein
MGQVVQLRFFGGLTIAETASILNVADDTVVRDWDFARTELVTPATQRQEARPPS